MRVFRYILFATFVVSWANATSVVVKLTDARIIIAADTQANRDYLHSKSSAYDVCKIIALGKAAFAATGRMDYKGTPDDKVTDWDANTDAHAAYELHSNDLQAAADDWGGRAAAYFESMYVYHTAAVRKLSSSNPYGLLVIGWFVGWNKGKAILVSESVIFNEQQIPAVTSGQRVSSARESPFSPNGIPEELTNGETERSMKFASEWKAKEKKIPPNQRDWRWLEFAIQATSAYDKDVGGAVDVLEMLQNGKQKWLQKPTCPKLAAMHTKNVARSAR